MNEAGKCFDQPLIPHIEPAEVLKPRVCSLNDPALPVSPEFSAILMRSFLVVAPRRDYGLDPSCREPLPKRIRIVGPVQHEAFGAATWPSAMPRLRHRHSGEHGLQQRHLRRGRRLQGNSERSTLAIDQNHKLCALSPLGFADFRAPFFAETKVPSAKHSSQRICSLSESCERKARQRPSRVPSSSHRLSLRQQVLELAYRPFRGNSLQGAPVQSTQRIPSNTLRSLFQGLPPFWPLFSLGRCGFTLSHCLSVSPRHIAQLRVKNSKWRNFNSISQVMK